jgi:hypothetical protein
MTEALQLLSELTHYWSCPWAFCSANPTRIPTQPLASTMRWAASYLVA